MIIYILIILFIMFNIFTSININETININGGSIVVPKCLGFPKKELGRGWMGIVYNIKYTSNIKEFPKTNSLCLKRQKVYPNDEFNKSVKIWTEIKFYDFINRLSDEYKKHFMTLYYYQFTKLDSPNDFVVEYKYNNSHIDALKKSNVVLDLYLSKVDHELYSTKLNKFGFNLDPILFEDYNNFVDTIVKLTHMLKENEWQYSDLHLGNIMYNKDKSGITYVLVDYGSVSDKVVKSVKNIPLRIFILKSILFIDDKIIFKDKTPFPKMVDKLPLYNYVAEQLKLRDIKLFNKIKKLIDFYDFDNDTKKTYNYFKNYEYSVNMDIIIYLSLLDRKLLCDILDTDYVPIINDSVEFNEKIIKLL